MANYQSDIRLGDFSVELTLNPESSSLETKCLIANGYGARIVRIFEGYLSLETPVIAFNEKAPDDSKIQGQLNLQVRMEDNKKIVTLIGELNYGLEPGDVNYFQGVLAMFEVVGGDIPAPPPTPAL